MLKFMIFGNKEGGFSSSSDSPDPSINLNKTGGKNE